MEEQGEGKEDEDDEEEEEGEGACCFQQWQHRQRNNRGLTVAFLCACTLSGVAAPDIIRAPLVG